MMDKRYLNLDETSTWHASFQDLVYESTTWNDIKRRVERPRSDFIVQLVNAEQHVSDALAVELRASALQILRQHYTHVVAHHGCRPESEASYRTRGILPANTALLLARAKELFGDLPGFDKEACSFPSGYHDHNNGKVWMLFSKTWVIEDRVGHVNGSETLRTIASRLGPEAQRRMDGTGKPSLITCTVPIDWIENDAFCGSALGIYANHVIEALVKDRIYPDRRWRGQTGGFALMRALPPSEIIEICLMDAD